VEHRCESLIEVASVVRDGNARSMMAQYEEETELRFIHLNSRWSGGPGFETLEDYLRAALIEVVEKLPQSEAPLAKVLAEIVEEMEGEEASQ
jgi:hypothetical protein